MGQPTPYDATVVTSDDGRISETRLIAVQLFRPTLDALPDSGFVLADPRTQDDLDQVQGRTAPS